MRLARAGTSSTVRRDYRFPTKSGTVRLDDLSLLIPSTMNWITSCLPTIQESGRFFDRPHCRDLLNERIGLFATIEHST